MEYNKSASKIQIKSRRRSKLVTHHDNYKVYIINIIVILNIIYYNIVIIILICILIILKL